MKKINQEAQADFANLLRQKAPNLSNDEISNSYHKIIQCIDIYLKQAPFQSEIDKPSLARKELSKLSSSINSVINQIRMLDGTSQVHLVKLGFKSDATQSTLRDLYGLVVKAENSANAKPDKSSNDSLTYLAGNIHFLLGETLIPHGKESTKQLVNDIFVLIAPHRWKTINAIKSQEPDQPPRGIIPTDIGRHYDSALLNKDIFSD